MGLFHSLRPNLRSFEIIKLLPHKVMFLVSRALPLQYSPRSQTSPNTFPTLLSILPFPPTVRCFLPQCPMGWRKCTGIPYHLEPPGLQSRPRKPQELSSLLVSIVQSVQASQARGWQRDVLSAGLNSFVTSLPWAQ